MKKIKTHILVALFAAGVLVLPMAGTALAQADLSDLNPVDMDNQLVGAVSCFDSQACLDRM